MPITVVNKHTHRQDVEGEHDIYIGRGSVLGNPYRITTQVTRLNAIALYERWLTKRLRRHQPDYDRRITRALNEIASLVRDGHQVNLVCFCKPSACHGDVIKRLVERKLDAE